ncbi:hypothetical protein A8924_0388 [Saccharopolyspora erythraea NRRL 2338]|nr:hypothetical protein A8924_0388 [Saccharopolyspora erythraea NRRL 2338]
MDSPLSGGWGLAFGRAGCSGPAVARGGGSPVGSAGSGIAGAMCRAWRGRASRRRGGRDEDVSGGEGARPAGGGTTRRGVATARRCRRDGIGRGRAVRWAIGRGGRRQVGGQVTADERRPTPAIHRARLRSQWPSEFGQPDHGRPGRYPAARGPQVTASPTEANGRRRSRRPTPPSAQVHTSRQARPGPTTRPATTGIRPIGPGPHVAASPTKTNRPRRPRPAHGPGRRGCPVRADRPCRDQRKRHIRPLSQTPPPLGGAAGSPGAGGPRSRPAAAAGPAACTVSRRCRGDPDPGCGGGRGASSARPGPGP